jgi:hypothetical protein
LREFFSADVFRSFSTENQYQYLRMHREAVELGCKYQQLQRHIGRSA